jgi:hypothetical protein
MGRHPKPVTKAAVPSASADCPALTGEPEEADITSPIFFWSRNPQLGLRTLEIGYLTIRYMLTPSPLGHVLCLTSLTYLVVTGTTTAPHASNGVAKKAPLQTNPLQTPAPSLAKT